MPTELSASAGSHARPGVITAARGLRTSFCGSRAPVDGLLRPRCRVVGSGRAFRDQRELLLPRRRIADSAVSNIVNRTRDVRRLFPSSSAPRLRHLRIASMRAGLLAAAARGHGQLVLLRIASVCGAPSRRASRDSSLGALVDLVDAQQLDSAALFWRAIAAARCAARRTTARTSRGLRVVQVGLLAAFRATLAVCSRGRVPPLPTRAWLDAARASSSLRCGAPRRQPPALPTRAARSREARKADNRAVRFIVRSAGASACSSSRLGLAASMLAGRVLLRDVERELRVGWAR